jgi:hypothetical protein
MLSTSLFFFLLLFGFAAADRGQLSPPYNHFYEFPVPIPPLKVPLVLARLFQFKPDEI